MSHSTEETKNLPASTRTHVLEQDMYDGNRSEDDLPSPPGVLRLPEPDSPYADSATTMPEDGFGLESMSHNEQCVAVAGDPSAITLDNVAASALTADELEPTSDDPCTATDNQLYAALLQGPLLPSLSQDIAAMTPANNREDGNGVSDHDQASATTQKNILVADHTTPRSQCRFVRNLSAWLLAFICSTLLFALGYATRCLVEPTHTPRFRLWCTTQEIAVFRVPAVPYVRVPKNSAPAQHATAVPLLRPRKKPQRPPIMVMVEAPQTVANDIGRMCQLSPATLRQVSPNSSTAKMWRIPCPERLWNKKPQGTCMFKFKSGDRKMPSAFISLCI